MLTQSRTYRPHNVNMYSPMFWTRNPISGPQEVIVESRHLLIELVPYNKLCANYLFCFLYFLSWFIGLLQFDFLASAVFKPLTASSPLNVNPPRYT